jgi:Phage integrase family
MAGACRQKAGIFVLRGSKPSAVSRAPRTAHAGHLATAIEDCGLPPLTWYQATRHTFASHWVLGGGSIEKLRVIMGHESRKTTERYAHLRTDLFRDADCGAVSVDLSPTKGKIIPMVASRPDSGAVGCGAGAEDIASDTGDAVKTYSHK